MMEEVTYITAVFYGLLSFFSGCVLPLVPSYFSFIAGVSFEEMTENPDAALRRKVFLATLAFVSGFSTIFILLGASATYLSGLLFAYKSYLRIFGGCLIIIFGLHLLGVVRIGFLNMEKRLHPKDKPLHFLGTFMIGMAFAAGWSPCIGPMLGSILILAGDQDTVGKGILLLALYSAGLAIPFVVLSVATNYLVRFMRGMSRAMRAINITAGLLLIVTGLLLITDKFSLLASLL
jgi:cytochrome c-type biogenesis protein